MNDVAPLVQMKLPSANEVMLRINDVALCANGTNPFTRCAEIELIFNLKCAIMEAERRCDYGSS